MIKSLKEYLEPEDIILEEGSNQSGEYIKCESGKLLMKTAIALVSFGFSPYFPYPPQVIPTRIDTDIYVSRWF
jgi:hypothetical protein